MTIKSNNIELFENLAQSYWNNLYYDFHNDFYCLSINLDNEKLVLNFINLDNNLNASMHFDKVSITKLEIDSLQKNHKLSIDTIYRGRFEKDGSLFEFSSDDRSYFYLEFYEGIKMEFFSKGIVLVI